MRIYLDNAATSYPKAPGVGAALKHFIEQIGDNANRSGYHTPTASDEMVYETRELLAEFFNFPTPENVVFTLNITYALNIVLKGSLEPGDHVVVSSMEHNAVMRPLMQLQRQGVQVSRMACYQMVRLAASTLCEHIQPNTKMVIVTHASMYQEQSCPSKNWGRSARKGTSFHCGHCSNRRSFGDRLSAHQGRCPGLHGTQRPIGPQGIGGFLISAELAAATDALISGGTACQSQKRFPYLPDKFEAGTLNLPAICGLKQAIEYVMDVGLASLRNKELRLAELLLEGLGNIKESISRGFLKPMAAWLLSPRTLKGTTMARWPTISSGTTPSKLAAVCTALPQPIRLWAPFPKGRCVSLQDPSTRKRRSNTPFPPSIRCSRRLEVIGGEGSKRTCHWA